MSLRDELNAVTPRLRRYARALSTGSPAGSDLADELVRATLMRALGARAVTGSGDLVIRLYATITQLHRETAVVGRSAIAAGSGRPALVAGAGGMPSPARHTKLSAALLSLPLDTREALLLVTLEGFEHGEAARILRISRSVSYQPADPGPHVARRLLADTAGGQTGSGVAQCALPSSRDLMAAITSSLSDAELHGLVDGQIEAERRADILRRAASSATDRARIESWQEQADLIRAAFRGVDREPVPSTLDLQSPARLVSLSPVEPIGGKRDEANAAPIAAGPERSTLRRSVYAGLTMVVIAAGLAGAWILSDSSPGRSDLLDPVRGTVEDVLAARTAAALAARTVAPMAGAPVAMPTTSIPDLTSVGFTLSGADVQPGDPVSLVFRYRNAAAEQIVIGVARAPGDWQKGTPGANEDVVVWRVGGKAYAIAGTLRPDRLRAIATSLRDEAIEE